ncbi:MAG: amidohydrolase [Pseudomonadota bacterium]
MIRFLTAGFALMLAACGGSTDDVQAGSENVEADDGAFATLYTGGTVYTGLDAPQTVESVLVGQNGRIISIGREEDIVSEFIGQIDRVDLGTGTMFPGFVDGHAHLIGIGQRELTLDLSATTSIEQLKEQIASEVDKVSPGTVIYGRGWIETGWPENRMPAASDIDSVSRENPVVLIRADGHALVANSAAIEAAGITDETPDPDGGSIERDDTAAATGIFVDNAMAPLRALVSEPGDQEREAALALGAQVYADRGWTGLHNMSVDPAEAPLMEKLDNQGRLPVRLHNAFNPDGMDLASARRHETDTIQNRSVKLYMDGALGSRGALLFEPYTDRPDTMGLALRARNETLTAFETALENNVQIAVHAIGDRANFDAVTWMSDALAGEPNADDTRWRVEHAQIIRPQDIPLFSEHGIIASMQPSHAIGDLKFAPDRLGQARLAGAYAWSSLLDAGALVVSGSDAPVEVGSPVIEFYAATIRKAVDGTSGRGWHPEEAMSRMEALHSFTLAPAYASFQEDELGTIEPGKWADFSVFDKDLMTVSGPEMLETRAVMTVVAGEIVSTNSP